MLISGEIQKGEIEMKILYVPQLSMRTYEKKPKFLVSSDAQWTKSKRIIFELAKANDVNVIFPFNIEEDEEIYNHNIKVIFNEETLNARQGRYSFSFSKCKEIENPEIIWLEIPELVVNYSVAFPDALIITTFEHIIDDYIFRQVEGLINSHVSIFPIPEHFWKFCRKASKQGINLVTDDKLIDYWTYFFDEEEIIAYRQLFKEDSIIFSCRLTDEERTHPRSLVKAFKHFLSKKKTIYVMNPTRTSCPSYFNDLLSFPNFHFFENGVSRGRYLELMAASKVSIFPYSFDDFYSVSLMESLGLLTVPVTKHSKFLQEEVRNGFKFCDFSNDDYIIASIEEAFNLNHEKDFDSYILNFSSAAWMEYVISSLEKFYIYGRE